MSESEKTKIAVIATNIDYIKKDISDIKQCVRELSGIYITKAEADDLKETVDLRIKQLEKSSNLWRFLSPALATIISSSVTFLLLSYINNLGDK